MVAALYQQDSESANAQRHESFCCITAVRQSCLIIAALFAIAFAVDPIQAQEFRRTSNSQTAAGDDELEGAPEPTALFRQSQSGRRAESQANRRSSGSNFTEPRSANTAVTPAAYTVDSEADGSGSGESTQFTEADATAGSDEQPFLDLTQDTAVQTSRSKGKAAGSESAEPIIRTLATCVIIGCLSILGILGLRRWQRSKGLLPGAGGRSRVIETLSLGPGRTVSLIEMDGIRALVGADSGGIRTIVMAPRGFSEELAEQQGSELNSLNL